MAKEEEHKNFEYNSLTDKLSGNITIIIVGVSIIAALYLAFFVVV